MPEGPRIAFLKEQLDQFVGQPVVEAQGTAKNIPFPLLPEQTLTEIKTFGKELLLCFPDFALRIHLLFFGKYALNAELNRELQLGLTFESGTINFYACDCRYISEPLEQLYDWTTDVLHPSFDPDKALQKLLRQPKQLICDAILEQSIVAGVGNGIKNEALFRCHLHPASVVGEIPEPILKNLVRACVTFSQEYLSWKQENTPTKNWQVYQRNTCPRDLVPLRKEKLGKTKRSCYFCEKCQELYAASF
ncbi:endonuclease [Adhaeribacter pallidiroseus]|uniref:Putative endonuclease 8 n=1 Tax=Adhaeribacter pallidiroseus TaxID=2072847 RepID=A0A369QGT0_9BACT|nr:endonuclease [Adhaeribacter pallidiroseus]RDC62477.1 putative endonuclease 8 [Adhaeribacter pallidiroseus]